MTGERSGAILHKWPDEHIRVRIFLPADMLEVARILKVLAREWPRATFTNDSEGNMDVLIPVRHEVPDDE